MFTAVCPVHIGDNPFWSAPEGLGRVEAFLRRLSGTPQVGRVLVVGGEERVLALAAALGLEAVGAGGDAPPAGPYALEDMAACVGRLLEAGRLGEDEAVLFADHRNLLCDDAALERARRAFERHPDACAASVSPSRDHPCQCRAYLTLLGAELIPFPDHSPAGSGQDGVLRHILRPRFSRYAPVTVAVRPEAGRWTVTAHAAPDQPGILFLQVLPLTGAGPDYHRAAEVRLDAAATEFSIDSPVPLTGCLATLTAQDGQGRYDVQEAFTARNTPWEVSPLGCAVMDRDTCAPIRGRQQFAPIAVHDGALAVGRAGVLARGGRDAHVPFLLERAHIVTDWFDYFQVCTL